MFNRWFASIPGPTLCNRAFAHYGTSFGHVGMEMFYAEHAVQEHLRAAARGNGTTAKSTTSIRRARRSKCQPAAAPAAALRHVHAVPRRLRKRHAAGLLVHRAELQRSRGRRAARRASRPTSIPIITCGKASGSSRRSTTRIRQNAALWPNRRALLIVYDEHGGIYDHVPPPACTPDGFVAQPDATGHGRSRSCSIGSACACRRCWSRRGCRKGTGRQRPRLRARVDSGDGDRLADRPLQRSVAAREERRDVSRSPHGADGPARLHRIQPLRTRRTSMAKVTVIRVPKTPKSRVRPDAQGLATAAGTGQEPRDGHWPTRRHETQTTGQDRSAGIALHRRDDRRASSGGGTRRASGGDAAKTSGDQDEEVAHGKTEVAMSARVAAVVATGGRRDTRRSARGHRRARPARSCATRATGWPRTAGRLAANSSSVARRPS